MAYFVLYGGGFALIRDTKAATSVACPWPFPEAKVYDPNGFYERSRATGAVLPRHLVGMAERANPDDPM